jgi:mannitol-specific phosphotransferase system IIBC component
VNDDPQRKSLSVYDYSDKSIQHAWIAVLAYAGLRLFGTIMAALQQPDAMVAFILDAVFHTVILSLLAFGIYKKSRIAVALSLLFVVGTQLYIWIAMGSFSGTVVAVIVTGFLLRGAKRIFEHHRELQEARVEQTKSA